MDDIIMNSRDIDPAYRYQEIDELLERCKEGKIQQNALVQEEKTAAKAEADAKSLKTAQKEEALCRLEALVEKVGLDSSVLDCWKNGNCQLTFCDIEENYVGKAEDMYSKRGEAGEKYVYKAGDVDWIDEVTDFEDYEDSMVYHVIQQGERFYFSL